MIITVTLLWYFSGVASIIFWWTRDYDYCAQEIPITALVGLIGPFAFLVGWVVHTDRSEKILIRKRVKK